MQSTMVNAIIECLNGKSDCYSTAKYSASQPAIQLKCILQRKLYIIPGALLHGSLYPDAANSNPHSGLKLAVVEVSADMGVIGELPSPSLGVATGLLHAEILLPKEQQNELLRRAVDCSCSF